MIDNIAIHFVNIPIGCILIDISLKQKQSGGLAILLALH